MASFRCLALLAVLATLPLAQCENKQVQLLAPSSKEVTPRERRDWRKKAKEQNLELCIIEPGKEGTDDALAIDDMLNGDCRKDSLIVFPGPVYHLNSTMNTTQLENVSIDHRGRFLWSPDVDWWLTQSMPVGFQNQSTVWYFGGKNVSWNGHGEGTLDGNGQVWYDWAAGRGNLPHRPMMINFRHLYNSTVSGLRFVQSQMWTMAIMYSHDLVFEDIYVNNTSTSEHSTLNTDGVDTVYASNITFSRWSVTCGDDGIALKGNSSDIRVFDSEFYGGQGIAVGSLGQYEGAHEYVDNFYLRNNSFHDTRYAMYLKTWPGIRDGYPPNGGGGGLGYAQNIIMEDVKLDRVRGAPFFLWQCEQYEGNMGKDCQTSEYEFRDVVWRDVKGTTIAGNKLAGKLRCSKAAGGGCHNFTVEDYKVRAVGSDDLLTRWECENMNDNEGFTCVEPS